MQRGSVAHILRLLDDWPESPKDNIATTDVFLSILSAKKIPRSPLQANDYEIAKGCVIGTTRAIQAAHGGPLASEEHLKKIIDMLVDGLDDILLWMSACLGQCRTFVEENENFLPSCRMLIGHWGAALTQFCFFHPRLGNAMQASPLAASLVAGLWSWMDPRTHRPPFMIELNDGIDIPCGIIDALMCYTRRSKDATLAVLRTLSGSETSIDRNGASEMVHLGMMRLRLIRRACRKSTRSIPLIGRSLSLLAEAYTEFFKTGERHLLSALHNHAFLRELMSTIQYVGARLWNTRHPPSQYSLLSLPLIVECFTSWTYKAFSSSAAMCQLIQGGLFSVLLETLAFVQLSSVDDAAEDVTSTYKRQCESIGTLMSGFLIFPSVLRAMSKFFETKLDQEMLQGVLKKKGHWTADLWLSIQNAYEKRRSLLSSLHQGVPVLVCENRDVSSSTYIRGRPAY